MPAPCHRWTGTPDRPPPHLPAALPGVCPPGSPVQVVVISSSSLAAASPLRASWMNRRQPEINSNVRMMHTVTGLKFSQSPARQGRDDICHRGNPGQDEQNHRKGVDESLCQTLGQGLLLFPGHLCWHRRHPGSFRSDPESGPFSRAQFPEQFTTIQVTHLFPGSSGFPGKLPGVSAFIFLFSCCSS